MQLISTGFGWRVFPQYIRHKQSEQIYWSWLSTLTTQAVFTDMQAQDIILVYY